MGVVWQCLTAVQYLVTATLALNYGYGSATRLRRNAAGGDILIFDSSDIEVKLGDRVQLECGVKQGTVEFSCVWENDQGEIIEVNDVHSGDVHDAYSKPEKFTDNQCGIVIQAVEPSQIRTWQCMVFVGKETFTGFKRLRLRSGPPSTQGTPPTFSQSTRQPSISTSGPPSTQGTPPTFSQSTRQPSISTSDTDSEPDSHPDPDSESDGLSGGAIAGIVIGVLLGVVFLIALVIAVLRYMYK